MKTEDAIRKINLVVDRTITEWGNVMLEVAESANTLLKNRIINTGYNANGELYPPYSIKPMHVWCGSMTQSACTKAQAKYKRKRPKDSTDPLKSFTLENGYKEYRELHGRQTGFVDFAFSGRMWASVKVVSGDTEHAKGIARISTLKADEMKKLEGNTERKGIILDLSNSEIYSLSRLMEKRLIQMWHTQGL